MAQQDNIIIIKTEKNITTSILDYFLNVALVTPITEEDLNTGKTFPASGIEVYNSFNEVADKFKSVSKIYCIARDVFAQKNNNGVNQSNLKTLTILKKSDEHATFSDCLADLNYNNAYYLIVNASLDSDIKSAHDWVSANGSRKLVFAQTVDTNVPTSSTNEIATTLKEANAGRCALYYHTKTDESLAGSLSAIMASYPIGGKTASYKKPTGVTVSKLTGTEETYLNSKNVNHFVYFIGSAGDYGKRALTSANGVTCDGTEIEEIIAVDRAVLSLQASLMDALEMDIPYDDNGGNIIYEKVNGVFATLKREGILAEESVDPETGEAEKSYTINVFTRAELKKYYAEYFAQKMFVVECTIALAGSGKKVMLTLAY